jgi:hypothetical protein
VRPRAAHTRHAATQRLASLDTVLRRMDVRATDVRSLRDDLAKERGQINETLAKLTERLAQIRTECALDSPAIRDIDQFAQMAQRHLEVLSNLIQGARKKATGISCVQLDPAALSARNLEFKAKIEQGRQQLENIRHESGGDRPWANFRSLTSVWFEYLDYVAGLCLRHEGVDDGVCEIADALISELAQAAEGLSALAIPGRESGAGTLPRAVYLRFPEWTVWALPLAVRELWHIAREAAYIGTNFINFAKRKGLPVDELGNQAIASRLHECLADVFAIYVMGPAYACASLLLALDPSKSSHQERAEGILTSLLWLGAPLNTKPSEAEPSEMNPYHRVYDRLRSSWNEAVRDAGGVPTTMSPTVRAWTDAFSDYLAMIDGLRFPTARWVAIRRDWTAALASGNVADLAIEGASVRFALNAAWKARLEEPARVLALADVCTQLCRRLMADGGHGGTLAALAGLPGQGSAPNLAR